MKAVLVFSVMCAAALLSRASLADNSQLYRWTDAQGVVHYSDQPPQQPVADLKTSDLPEFPAVDQAKLDKEQAALFAEAAALQQLAQTQAQAQADARLAAAALAADQVPAIVPATDDSYTPEPIYVSSAFVPRAYRANLYLPRRTSSQAVSRTRPSSGRPAMSSRP
ncbi:MAG TPA: DUF4124 domain-containing protein [Gammaproteobacteria bacterium]|jgi:hypothetical protein